MPNLNKLSAFIIRHYKAIIAVFLVLLAPAIYGYANGQVYYKSIRRSRGIWKSIVANEKLDENFNMNSTHMLLVDADISDKDAGGMISEMEQVDGVKAVMGLASVIGPSVPDEALPDSIMELLKSDDYQLMLISSEYEVASDEVNAQVEILSSIAKKYDKDAMLIGEAPVRKI